MIKKEIFLRSKYNQVDVKMGQSESFAGDEARHWYSDEKTKHQDTLQSGIKAFTSTPKTICHIRFKNE